MLVTLLVALLATFSPILAQNVLHGGPGAVIRHVPQGAYSIDGPSSGGPTG